MPELRAIIFDFDGTVLDTESACYMSWKEVYDTFACELPIEVWKNVVGTAVGTFDPWDYLEEQLGHHVQREKLERGRRSRELDLVATLHLQPGVRPLIEEARAEGIRIGLATSSHADWVDKHLRRLDAVSMFETIVTADDVEHVKPAPDLYLLAARRLGVKPVESVAIEDSPTGAAAAHNAGIPCLVIPNSVTEHYEFPSADAICPTLHGVTVADVRALWRKSVRT